MHIIYAVTTCSDRVYRYLFENVEKKPGFQAQKYHRLLIEGLASHTEVDVVANPPVNPELMEQDRIPLADEKEGGASYHYIDAIRSSGRKYPAVFFGTFWKSIRLMRKDSVVVVDCLNRFASLAGLLAARLCRKPCVGIVTDLPDMLSGGRLQVGLANFVIAHCTHYVLMTEAMNTYLNHKGRPYVVLEGHADISMAERMPSLQSKLRPRVCLYAGGLSRQYGLHNLVEGFQMAELPDTVLHLYGCGDYVEELKEIAARDSRIVYGGMLLSDQVVEKERTATLLINPRPTNEEYVKYSFPSKTMEYMSTGTPVMTTVLPGMPKEYHDYVYLLPDETPQGIAARLREVLAQSDEELLEKGCAARKFILENRNNHIQAGAILRMLNQ